VLYSAAQALERLVREIRRLMADLQATRLQCQQAESVLHVQQCRSRILAGIPNSLSVQPSDEVVSLSPLGSIVALRCSLDAGEGGPFEVQARQREAASDARSCAW
jgi:hypothetical protein